MIPLNSLYLNVLMPLEVQYSSPPFCHIQYTEGKISSIFQTCCTNKMWERLWYVVTKNYKNVLWLYLAEL